MGDADATYPAGAEAAGAGVSSSIDSLLQPMIIDSDNNAFSSLRNSYDSSGFAEWLSSCGVDSSIMHDTHFPRYSARESALLWLHTYQYLETDTPTAQHLASLYAQTNVSFIRAGVGSVKAWKPCATRQVGAQAAPASRACAMRALSNAPTAPPTL